MRVDIAYALIVVLLLAIAAVIVQTRRYTRYRSLLMRGRRPSRAVRKPFWLP